MGSTFWGLFTIFFSHFFSLLRTVSLIILLYGIGFFTNAFTENIYLAGYCIFHKVAFTYLTSNSDKRSLGKAMGNFTAIGDIGRIPFTSLAGFIAAISTFGFSGWRIVCLTYEKLKKNYLLENQSLED